MNRSSFCRDDVYSLTTSALALILPGGGAAKAAITPRGTDVRAGYAARTRPADGS